MSVETITNKGQTQLCDFDAKILGSITKTQQRKWPAQPVGLPRGWVDIMAPEADLQKADLLGEGAAARRKLRRKLEEGGEAGVTNSTTAAGALTRSCKT